MNLGEACNEILGQLLFVTKNLKDKDYSQPIPLLNQATIGQHIRHTLEFFICLINGYKAGTVCYDRRAHDSRIETQKGVAKNEIARLIDFIGAQPQNKDMSLEANYSLHEGDIIAVKTNYHRELAYNIEHAVHHMAIIKIGILQVAPYIQLPQHFGVAVSTVRYNGLQATVNS